MLLPPHTSCRADSTPAVGGTQSHDLPRRGPHRAGLALAMLVKTAKGCMLGLALYAAWYAAEAYSLYDIVWWALCWLVFFYGMASAGELIRYVG